MKWIGSLGSIVLILGAFNGPKSLAQSIKAHPTFIAPLLSSHQPQTLLSQESSIQPQSNPSQPQLIAQALNTTPSPIQPLEPKTLDLQPLPTRPNLLPPPNKRPTEPIAPTQEEETLTVKAFKIIGNTVFSDEELQQIIQPYLGIPLTFQELLNVRSKLTEFYIEQGYVTSGAFIPANQDLSQAIVTLQILEGKLDEIRILGNQKLNASYIRNRIAKGTEGPLNIKQLLKRLQTFQLNPQIEKVSAELATSDVPGFNILIVTVEEADSRDIHLNLNNNRSANIGRFQRQITFRDRNLSGLGDHAHLSYGNTDGSHELDAGYNIPVNVQDGTINIGFTQSWTRIITEPFNQLDLEGTARTFSLGFRQPVLTTPKQQVSLGLQVERRESNTTLLGRPFPLSAGSDAEGRTKVSGVNFTQEWVTRDQNQIFALHSDLGIGLDIAATQNSNAPDGRFFHWRGQAQWVRQLARESSLLLRSNLQLADRALPSMEQFGLGGVNSLRGYPNDFLLVDNGLTASSEARLPIFKTKNRQGILHLVPFIDYGYGWNWNNQEIIGSNHALAGGLGLRWQWSDRINGQVHWGVPFIATAGQSSGIDASQVYFSINTKLF